MAERSDDININVIQEPDINDSWMPRTRFVVQAFLMVGLVAYSIFEIATTGQPLTSKDIWIGVLTGTIGLNAPAPKWKK